VAADFRAAKVGEGLAPRTIKKYDHAIKLLKEFAEELEVARVNQITPVFMDRFRAKRVELLSKKPGRDGQKTACNDLVLIREVVNYALARKMIKDDPLDGYSIKKAKTKPQPFWDQGEFDRIVAAATRQPHKDIYHLLGLTGLRVGEVEHLAWSDLDFENNVIKIQGKPGWKPKTGDARSVPMMAGVKEILQRQPRRCEWVFSFAADARGPARQVRQRRLLDYLKRLLRKLGLPGHLHTLRHTFISLALTRGVDVATVRSWVGHVDQTTIGFYTHIASDGSRAAMERLEASIHEHRSRS
jgi:integrase